MSLTITSKAKLNSGYEIPRLGLGVYLSTGSACVDASTAALKHGYIHIDSAVGYENEAEVGKAIKESGVKREDIFVTSKVMSHGQDYESTLKTVDRSLKNFGFDYIDLYLVHDPLGGKQSRLDLYRALVDAQKAGKIRSVGVSNFGVPHLEELAAAGLPTPAVNQIELHPYCQQRPITKYAADHGILIEAYAPLIRGQIAEDDAIRKIAAAKGVSPFQILVRWSLQKGYVVLPKSEKAERIAANADVYGFELSDTELAEIDALDKGTEGAITWNPVAAP